MHELISFTRGVPPTEAFPTAALAEALAASVTRDPAVVLQYGQQQGYPPLRALLAERHGVRADEILVGNGSLQLQDLVASVLVRPGDTVLTEQPSYDRAIATFRRRGARVIGIPLGDDGLDLTRFAAEVARQTPAFVYLVPDFQNPAGITTSAAHRRAIVALAEQHGFWVIEDVPYRSLRYRGTAEPQLRELGDSRVITMTSFSKLLSPGLRVGYMIAPAALITRVTREGENQYLSPVLPTQAAVAELLRQGLLDDTIAALLTLYRPRWQAMLQALDQTLPGVPHSTPDGGFFVSLTLPPDANSADLVGRARAAGLLLTDGRAFFAEPLADTTPAGERFVRLPFCAVTPEQIAEGVRRLATLL